MLVAMALDDSFSMTGLGLVAWLALGACTESPTPGDTAGSTSLGTTAASTDDGPTGADSTGPVSTGPDPMAEATDCDALRDQAACEALSGSDFQCVWFPEAYAVVLDGESCTVGDAIGWCIAAGNGETGCVEDIVYECAAGGTQSDVFVREAEDGTTVVIQDQSLSSTEFGCLGPMLWDGCDAADGPAACVCGCDPGLPP
jgi:hypothetical protein